MTPVTRRGLLGGISALPVLAARPVRKERRPVSSYKPCGGSPVTQLASADTTGVNAGNLTNAFTTGVLGTMPAIWELYHAIIDCQEPGETFTPASCSIRANIRKPVSFTYPNGGSEWDPAQPIQFREGDELYFFWQLAESSTPVPQVTLFLRYDEDLSVNRNFRG